MLLKRIESGVIVFLFLLMALPSWPTANATADEAGAIVDSLAEELKAKTQPIEDPTGAMTRFYQALSRTAAKKPGAITRISHFGDSLIEMELLPAPVRVHLQTKWGDSGHGFILPSRPKPWYRPRHVLFDPASAWICTDMHSETPRNRCFGLGGAYGLAYKSDAKVTIGTDKKGPVGQNVSRFQILFPLEPEGGVITVKLDGKTLGRIDTAAEGYLEAFAEITAPDGPHKLQLIAEKQGLRMHGVILERETPGVVYDALGINGSGVDTYLSADETHWIGQIKHRNPDLVIMGIGTNDTFPELDLKGYARDLKKLIRRIKQARPNGSILFMAPLDRALKVGGELVSNPMTPRIVATQRQVAAEMEIAFWSAFDAMGGEGSMARWFYARPRLGAGDFFHPTPQGGEVLGEMFYQALMQGFAAHLKEQGISGPLPAPEADPLKQVQIVK